MNNINNTNNTILPIVVIYNTDWKDCNAYKSLFSYYDGDVLLYDNSPQDANKRYGNVHLHYHHDPLNRGLSVAYNYGAKWAKANDFDFIALFDEDTILPKDYIGTLNRAISENKEISLFAPTLKYKKGYFSPCRYSWYHIKGTYLAPGTYDLHRYIPVNSGACIRIDSFIKNGGYNENIPLDFSDFDFFLRLKDVCSSFQVMDSIGTQQFSNEERDKDVLLRRYRFYLKGAASFFNPQLIWFHVLKHTMSLTIRTHSMIFIKLYAKYLRRNSL